MLKSLQHYYGTSLDHQSWDYVFNEAALKVEELLSSGHILEYDKSRLRIALEEKFIDWKTYKNWFIRHHSVSQLSDRLGPSDLQKLNLLYKKNKSSFENQKIWSSDLVPINIWNGKTIVLGFHYPEEIYQLKNIIFVLCSPQNLSKITDINFSKESLETSWVNIESNHSEVTDKVRKHYDGFIIMKIENNKAMLYKADEELEKEKFDFSCLELSLTESNMYTKSLEKSTPLDLDLQDLGLNILDYKSIAISTLKRGQHPVGFFIAFKTDQITNNDLKNLETITLETMTAAC